MSFAWITTYWDKIANGYYPICVVQAFHTYRINLSPYRQDCVCFQTKENSVFIIVIRVIPLNLIEQNQYEQFDAHVHVILKTPRMLHLMIGTPSLRQLSQQRLTACKVL